MHKIKKCAFFLTESLYDNSFQIFRDGVYVLDYSQWLNDPIQVLFSGTDSSALQSSGGYTYCKAPFWGMGNWFPRVNLPDKQGDFHVEVAVHPKELAICSGQLMGHEWSKDHNWKIFKYRVRASPLDSNISTTLILHVTSLFGPTDCSSPCNKSISCSRPL